MPKYITRNPAYAGQVIDRDVYAYVESITTATPGTVHSGVTSTCVATEGTKYVNVTQLTFTAVPLTLRDTEQGKGVQVYTFPEGRILMLGATGTVAMTTTSTILSTLNGGKTCNWGMGTATQSNAVLATTEQDIIQVANITSSATINVAGAASNSYGALAVWDGTTTAIKAFLNVSVPTAGDIDADATVTLTGSATIAWISLGDY